MTPSAWTKSHGQWSWRRSMTFNLATKMGQGAVHKLCQWAKVGGGERVQNSENS